MTVKEEYELMKKELRKWNVKSNWDNTKYKYPLEHATKKSKKMFLDLLNKDFESMNRKMKRGTISTKEYNKLWKVWNDCSTSIANMNII